jgi:CheY-like chemotaxis protein/HPt (histidine-containing phosphotransfer) domain-containing protein
VELASLIHTDVPHMVVGDYNRLRQVVVNLIGNALKFTEQGEVVMEVSRESHTDQQVTLHFQISDTGIGISPEKQATIFGMFEQADGSTTRRYGGTGLGLAIATRLVQLMGGRIWVDSALGRGSRFHFTTTLQLAEGEPVVPNPPEPVSLHGLRVLVVDDNATNRRILQEVLDSWQMSPAVVASADEAMRCLRSAHEAGEPFDLVLADAHMPHVDGLTLAQQIRQDIHARHTVIMMLTSGERSEDQAKCRELNVAAYLLKPIKQSELLDAIQVAMGVSIPKRVLQPVAESQEVRGLRILLAEDSLVNQKLAMALLQDRGHSVTLARNGSEAVAISAGSPFDLILMDVQMPEMDGFEATTAIREREGETGQRIPIVAMTAYALKGDRERCLTAGMDGYVAKPIRAQELFAAIGKLYPAASEPGGEEMTRSEMTSSVELVKWAEALEAVQGDRELLRTVVEAALEEIPQVLLAVRESIASQDGSRLHRSAHTLKSSLRYFGAQDAAEKAWQLETNGRDANLAESAATLAALEPLVAQIREELLRFIQAGK